MNERLSYPIVEELNRFLKDYKPSEFVTKDWPMKNGLYQQYSIFQDDGNTSVSGTNDSITAL